MARINFWRSSETPAQPALADVASGRDRHREEVGASEALQLVRQYEESGQGWFWSTNSDGRIVYLSRAVIPLLGEDAAVPGTAFAELFQRTETEGAPTRTLSFLFAKHSKFDKLMLKPARPGCDRWWSLSGSPQFDSSGAFTGYRGVGVDMTDEKRSSEDASHLALSDALTGLPNRLRMSQVLESSLANIDIHKRPCAVMLIDLDRFKQVNDTLGHPAGDALLRQVSDRLCRIVGDGEKVFRLGGDEFEVILRDCEDRGDLGRIANDIIAIVSQPYSIDGSRCVIGASIGIAIAPIDGRNADDVIRNADLALYAAKGAGRGRFHFFSDDLHKAADERRVIESELRDALARGEMQLAYQPIVCAEDNVVKGVESLIRWTHPTRGPISPARFIPIAEDANLIAPLGEWILRKACEDAANWPGHIRVAVNVSPSQFANEGFPEIVMSALAQSGLPPERLELEITEGVFLSESAATDAMFARLKAIGVRLALDDFGTGYSSLSYLKTAPFDKIKIDQSFVRQATLPGSRNRAIIAAIVALAEALGMETTAEGIESLDQLDLVQNLRVSHIQGFVYSPGVPCATLAEKLDNGEWVIEPSGPARQRSTRQSMYRKIGVVFGNHYQSALVRNLSDTGALIEGLSELQLETLLILDFGGGELAFARVRRVRKSQLGVEFETPMVTDGNGSFCVRHRVSPYALASIGLPDAGYPSEPTALRMMPGVAVEHVGAKLGLSMAGDGSGHGGLGIVGSTAAISLVNNNLLGDRRLTQSDVDRLVDAAKASQNPQLGPFVSLLVITGARQRELLEARWTHFDIPAGTWNIPDARSGKSRTVKLSRDAVNIIRALPRWDDCEFLIANPKTKRPYGSFASSWETVRRRAGLPYVEIDELRLNSAKSQRG